MTMADLVTSAISKNVVDILNQQLRPEKVSSEGNHPARNENIIVSETLLEKALEECIAAELKQHCGQIFAVKVCIQNQNKVNNILGLEKNQKCSSLGSRKNVATNTETETVSDITTNNITPIENVKTDKCINTSEKIVCSQCEQMKSIAENENVSISSNKRKRLNNFIGSLGLEATDSKRAKLKNSEVNDSSTLKSKTKEYRKQKPNKVEQIEKNLTKSRKRLGRRKTKEKIKQSSPVAFKRGKGRPKKVFFGHIDETGSLRKKAGRPFKNVFKLTDFLLKTDVNKLSNEVVLQGVKGQRVETNELGLKTALPESELKDNIKNFIQKLKASKLSDSKTTQSLNDAPEHKQKLNRSISRVKNKKINKNDETVLAHGSDKTTPSNEEPSVSEPIQIGDSIVKPDDSIVDAIQTATQSNDIVVSTGASKDDTTDKVVENNSLHNNRLDSPYNSPSLSRNNENEQSFANSSHISDCNTSLPSCLVKKPSKEHRSGPKRLQKKPSLNIHVNSIVIENPFPEGEEPFVSQEMIEKFNRQFFKSYVKITKIKNMRDKTSIQHWEQLNNEKLEKKRSQRTVLKEVSFRETVEVFGDIESDYSYDESESENHSTMDCDNDTEIAAETTQCDSIADETANDLGLD